MLIEMGVLFDQDRSLESERRFFIEDQLGTRFSRRAGEGLEKGLLWSERQRLYAENHATAADTRTVNCAKPSTLCVGPPRSASVKRRCSPLRSSACDRARGCGPGATTLAAHEARPRWLRIARELTPPTLRDRAGAALHRARRNTGS